MTPTKLLLSQLLIALKLDTLYQINAKTYYSFAMIRYANYLIYICMIINPNIRNKRKIAEKIRGYAYKTTQILAFNYPRAANLEPY